MLAIKIAAKMALFRWRLANQRKQFQKKIDNTEKKLGSANSLGDKLDHKQNNDLQQAFNKLRYVPQMTNKAVQIMNRVLVGGVRHCYDKWRRQKRAKFVRHTTNVHSSTRDLRHPLKRAQDNLLKDAFDKIKWIGYRNERVEKKMLLFAKNTMLKLRFAFNTWRNHSHGELLKDDLYEAANVVSDLFNMKNLQARFQKQNIAKCFYRWKNAPRMTKKLLAKFSRLTQNNTEYYFKRWMMYVLRHKVAQANEFWRLYLEMLSRKREKQLAKRIANSKGTIYVDSFLRGLYKNRLQSAFDEIRNIKARDEIKKRLFIRMLNKIGFTVRTAFLEWKGNVFKLSYEELENTYRLASIASRMLQLYQTYYVQNVSDKFRRWKNDPVLLYKRACRMMQERTLGKLKLYFIMWRQRNAILKNAEKFTKIYKVLKQLSEDLERAKRRAYYRWSGKAKRDIKYAMRQLINSWKVNLRSYFHGWRMNIIQTREELMNSTHHDIYLLAFLMRRYQQRALKVGMSTLSKLCVWEKQLKACNKMMWNLNKLQRTGIKRWKEFVQLDRDYNKVRACVLINYIKTEDWFAVMKRYYSRWRDSEYLRQRRLIRKYIIAWLFYGRIEYEQAFLRWMYNYYYGYKAIPLENKLLAGRITRGLARIQKRMLRTGLFHLMVKHGVGARLEVGPMGRFSAMTPQPTRRSQKMTPRPFSVNLGQQLQINNRVQGKVLNYLNGLLLKNIKSKFTVWKTKTGKHQSEIIDSLGEMPDSTYQALLRKGASRLLYELFTRSLHRKLEVIFYRWQKLLLMPKQMNLSSLLAKIEELTKQKRSLENRNQELREENLDLELNLEQSEFALQRVVQQLDDMRTARMFRVLQKTEYMAKVEAYYNLRELVLQEP